MVTSLKNEFPFSYMKGLAQPMDPLPTAKRAAFMFENIPAAMGQAADVPAAANVAPPVSLGLRTNILSPGNAKSGIPLKVVSYPATGIWPEASLAIMYAATAASCQAGLV
jgi:hypothetical protein